ncbi:aminotransferase class I/II-fold pyridoxal phosphate-dependent enzyme [Derxia gummosa]|uniref:Aminotransferase class I/II-fold pyridoxal phosphate-dependent enzyme n=1 Tax=Derxia gummosa DSM 723 TaxID=1121388 RepID=A0A8B6XD08_9BURK|nr:aminotransferase class I/II-fold pyridoxal phosphate-dependent enzyme [Derxia gummosa]
MEKDRLVIETVRSVEHLPASEWGGGFAIPTPMRREFLAVVERARVNDIETYYLTLRFGGALVAHANVYVCETDFSSFDPKLPADARGTVKQWFPGFMKFRIVEVGYFTMIGEGLALADSLLLDDVLIELEAELRRIAAESRADYILYRDIGIGHYAQYRAALAPLGYVPSIGFPNAVLPLRWDSLDAYLSALDSKTRLKLRNSLRLEEKFGIRHEIVRDFAPLADELARLWANVNARAADYSREQLTAAFFAECSEQLGESSEIITFRHEGRLIAFMLNLIGDDDYIMLDWGVDYDFEHYRDANLYRAASVLSVARAIELGCSRIEFGITNYTPKMTLGAEIRPLAYFVRHVSEPRFSGTLARLLTDAIEMPDNTAHAAGERLGTRREDLAAFERRIREDQNPLRDTDIFQRIGNYQRANAMRLGGIYGLYPEFNCAQDSVITFSDNRERVLLGTNSYLGLADDPRVREAAKAAIDRYGSGCSGSPLLNGTLDIHNRLEAELADFLGRDAVALCSTGYQTNLTALSALCGPGDVVLMDARNHRSLYDGVRLSGADCLIYRHADLGHLAKLLLRSSGRRRMIVTDSVFSMEGTIADLRGIAALAREHGARLFVDESHAVGVLGATGRGVAELQGVEADVDLVMGTFSKSFAALGGYVAGCRTVIDYLKHNGGGHIFSASLPPSVIATVLAALDIVRREPERRALVLDNAAYMAGELRAIGYDAPFHGAQIVPVILGNYTLALSAYKRFMEAGVYVNPVGPPAVPEAAAGFRTSYIATHRRADLDRALDVFRRHFPDIRR